MASKQALYFRSVEHERHFSARHVQPIVADCQMPRNHALIEIFGVVEVIPLIYPFRSTWTGREIAWALRTVSINLR